MRFSPLLGERPMFNSTRKVAALVTIFLCSSSALQHAAAAASKLLAAPGSAKGPQSDSLGIAYSQYLWPKVNGVATVYYVIDSQSDSNATPNIQAAIATSNADFPGLLQWVLWNSSLGPNYVDINLSASNISGVCEANEGYEAIPAQPMTGSTTCTIGTILHEMGHVIGLWHEQSRSDRATYITVNYNNVIKSAWSNFQILTDDQQTLSSYDYASVMEYIPFAFTSNGGPVIESIPAGIPMAGYEGVPAQAGPSGPALPAFDYSAGDKETIRRLYGAAPTQITVTSNPVGLSVIVDGMTVTTPQTYSWPLYSTHTLNVATEVQILSGYVLNSNSAVATDFYYTYGRWSNTASQSQSITVIPGNGSSTFPSTAPALSTYSANFIQLSPFIATVYPAGTGQLTVAPQPQYYSGAANPFFVAREQVTLTATAASGWNFYEFNNSPFWLPGGLGANPKTFYVPDSGNPVDTTAEFSNTPIYTVDIQPETFSSNSYVYVDSGFAYTPKNYSQFYDSSWTSGSSHTLSLGNPEYPYSSNSRFNFSSWSDGGTLSHAIVSLPATATSYVATVTPEYQPTTNFGYPPCGGSATLSPPSPTNDGFYPTGQKLSFVATPDAGWSFAGWTYDLTGVANPATLTANDETLVYANFNTVATPLTLTSISPSSGVVDGSAFTLTLTGTGFTAASLVSANGQYRTVTFVNSRRLTVPMTAADLKTLGGFQVFVENYPSGWKGCAVFGYQTFLVTGAGAPAAAPTFSPAAGIYHAAQSVTISDATPGETIYYTTNGTRPTTKSTPYTGAITVSSTETIKAIAAASGFTESPVASATYTIEPLAETPEFSPGPGTYRAAQSVTISDTTPGAVIHYTTSGAQPTIKSPTYTAPVSISKTEVLKAIAVASGYAESATASGTYTIR
jgi:Astacin (Peptidase family M12A)/Chitobiase/beta-hexosaminidase C-terminal domain/Divergent InlB B-repeat domain